jgi:hypothetical protein
VVEIGELGCVRRDRERPRPGILDGEEAKLCHGKKSSPMPRISKETEFFLENSVSIFSSKQRYRILIERPGF